MWVKHSATILVELPDGTLVFFHPQDVVTVVTQLKQMNRENEKRERKQKGIGEISPASSAKGKRKRHTCPQAKLTQV